MKYLLLVPTFIILAILGIILQGWVLSILWSWFIVPLFGLPMLSVSSAISIAIIVGLITHQYNDLDLKGKSIGEWVGCAISHSIFGPLLVLFIGWIVTLFI